MPLTGHHRPVLTVVRGRARATIAWGISLNSGPGGQLHESIAGLNLTDPLAARPDLEAVVSTETHGASRDQDLLVISRTATWAAEGLDEVPASTTAPPTQAETDALNAALDHLGYTGPRDIKLLLALDPA